jgi:signal transduction histidine kinase
MLLVILVSLVFAGTGEARPSRVPEAGWGAPLVQETPTAQEETTVRDADQSGVGDCPPWAWGALGIGVLVLVAVLVRWRTASLERQRRALEEVVAERTREGRRQKRQLEAYNRELLRTNEILRRTLEEKSRLLGMAAHDLKNPLFGIRALSEILLETEPLPEKRERKLDLIRQSADETLHLIDDLLSTAANAAQRDWAPEPIDLAGLTQWVVRGFEPQAERKEQTLSCTVDPDGPCTVRGDRRKLREAVSNLVGNALKYSPPGEGVDVRVDRRDGAVQVAVSDDGPGLSERDQQRMFAPFQRLSPEPTGGEGSSGLGLYIVKQIVDQHEGTIEVESAPGEGSTFVLSLPGTPSEGPAVPEATPTDVETT